MKDQKDRKVITHPDDLIEGKRYSFTFEDYGKRVRIAGRFIGLNSSAAKEDYTKGKPKRFSLVVILQRSLTNWIVVFWKQCSSWRQI